MSRLAACMLAAAGALCACSTVRSVYQAPTTFGAPAKPAVKRLQVLAWADAMQPGLGPVLGEVAADLVKLRRNYLVYGVATVKQHFAEGCHDRAEGVLLVRALDVARAGDAVTLQIAAELYRCADGALLWRGEARGKHDCTDASLADMASHYTSTLGSSAGVFAAPAFVLLQDLVGAMPQVDLSEADTLEKIELGHRAGPAPLGATAAR